MTVTFAEGDTCRVRNMRGVYKILKFELVRGEVAIYGGVPGTGKVMTRYVTTDRLLPARPGDVPPSTLRRR